jgi:hypothetical protein
MTEDYRPKTFPPTERRARPPRPEPQLLYAQHVKWHDGLRPSLCSEIAQPAGSLPKCYPEHYIDVARKCEVEMGVVQVSAAKMHLNFYAIWTASFCRGKYFISPHIQQPLPAAPFAVTACSSGPRRHTATVSEARRCNMPTASSRAKREVDCRTASYDAVSYCWCMPTFRRNLAPPSSLSKYATLHGLSSVKITVVTGNSVHGEWDWRTSSTHGMRHM